MADLDIKVLDAVVEPYAAVPTLMLRLGITEASGASVHAIALRGQLRIEPQKRRYSPEEEERLFELFGETPQWSKSLRPFLWMHVATTVPGFTATTEVDVPVTCSYDFEVAAAKYLHALGDGEIPLLLLFSGTVFSRGEQGVVVEPVAWHSEATYRLPVQVWRDMMDRYFPNSGWLRLQRETIDDLQRFKARRALPTWEQAIEALLKEAGES